jgi:hypothetical protein
MKEAVITVVVPDTDDEPAHTVVWRVEFEGEITDDNPCSEFTLHRVVSALQLTDRV